MKKINCLCSSAFLLLFISLASSAQTIKGTFAIKNVETGMLLRIKDANKKDGTPVVAYSPVNWKCMTWDFQHVEGQTYQLKNLFTGKTFQPKGITADSLNLEQQPITNSVLQQYEFIPAGDNFFLIRLKGTGLYVTPSYKEGKSNAAILLAEMRNTNLQKWTIYEQHPEF